MGTIPVYSLTIWEWRLSLRPGRIWSDICRTIWLDICRTIWSDICRTILRVNSDKTLCPTWVFDRWYTWRDLYTMQNAGTFIQFTVSMGTLSENHFFSSPEIFWLNCVLHLSVHRYVVNFSHFQLPLQNDCMPGHQTKEVVFQWFENSNMACQTSDCLRHFVFKLLELIWSHQTCHKPSFRGSEEVLLFVGVMQNLK